jgi:outer membrane lipoprotein SlyB
MKKRSCSLAAVVLALTIALFACGSDRSLQSVSVSPTAAKSSAQFTATGIYNKSPSNVDITTATTWCIGASSGACVGNINAGATVNSGTAHCTPGFTGSVTILAGQVSSAMADTGSQLKPFGAAQLNCP